MERLCALAGYRRIQTPVFEDTDLFARTSGQGSDVVQKEMYTFTDRSDRSLTLRPEGTAPIARAYVEHGLHRAPQPQKLYTIASMYRYGAPGRGRYREHWQLSVEALGSGEPAIDAEIILLYDTLLHRLGVSDYHLELNSIGCRECRPAYVESLRAWLAYDASCRVLRDHRLVAVAVAALVAVSAVAAGQLFAARASFLQVGAMLGTIMAANVFFVIIPAHWELVRAKQEGREPDPEPGLRAKQRSVHNNYLTLPVVFTMLAGHFPLTFGQDHAWLVLLAIFAIVAAIRHFFNRWHTGRREWWILGAAGAAAIAKIASSTSQA